MTALDLRHIHGAGVTANQQAAGESHFRQRIQTTLNESPGAIADAIASLQVLFNHRMLLEFLKLVEGADMWILVSQIDNQSERDLVVFDMIEEAAAAAGIAGAGHGITGSVNHQALPVLLLGNFPNFLDA